MLTSKGQFIKGEWYKGSGPLLQSTNPADNSIVWQGTQATDEEINNAHAAAKQAISTWSSLSFTERSHYLQVFVQSVKSKQEQLAELISLETGKPLWEAKTEASAVLAKVDISIKAYQERTYPNQAIGGDSKVKLRYKPQGVVVVLGAFNFPAHISNGHIIPALLAGNTLLYKPSEHTPAVAELIMQCWQSANMPAGVINCLQGGSEVGNTLLSKDIQGVYFTGSYRTGLRIHKTFSDKPEVILALEMGGNNPLIVEDAANMQAAVYTAIQSSFITSGQRCTCARRLLVPSNAFGDKFLKQFAHACAQIKVGKYNDQPQPFMGPIISHQQALTAVEAQNNLQNLGGTSILSMNLLAKKTGFLSPGIIDMTEVDNAPDDEIFAPLVQVYRYKDFERAIALANQTRYGLAAGLISDSEDKFHKFYSSIRAGLINWNRPTTGASSNLPFGGVGLSGNHRPSAYFAADYCAYPIASLEQETVVLPDQLAPGILLD